MTTMRIDGLTWRLTPEIVGIAALCAGDAFAAWSANNPSIFTVRTFRSQSGRESENSLEDIRLGSTLGTIVALMVGAGGSLVTGSYWPIVATAAVLVYEWVVYEWALRNPHNVRRSISDQA